MRNKVIDTVLPPPKDNYEDWLRWKNRIQTELQQLPYYKKVKIEVKHV